MKINSGPWKPDVPSLARSHNTLKYDFLFALKIWNLIVREIAMCCAGKWPLCSVSPSVPVSRNKSQSHKVTARSSLIDSQAGGITVHLYRQWPGILVTALALTIATGHTAATARVGWAHYQGGQMLWHNYCLWSRFPGSLGPWVNLVHCTDTVEFIKHQKQTWNCQKLDNCSLM